MLKSLNFQNLQFFSNHFSKMAILAPLKLVRSKKNFFHNFLHIKWHWKMHGLGSFGKKIPEPSTLLDINSRPLTLDINTVTSTTQVQCSAQHYNNQSVRFRKILSSVNRLLKVSYYIIKFFEIFRPIDRFVK